MRLLVTFGSLRMLKKRQNFPEEFVVFFQEMAFLATHVFESNSLVVWPGKGIRENQAAKGAYHLSIKYHNIQYGILNAVSLYLVLYV
jgi:hypothetical protein